MASLVDLPKAETFKNRDELEEYLEGIELPKVKIVLTGKGRVGTGAKEVLDHMKIREVSIQDYLNKYKNQAIRQKYRETR